MDVPVQGEVDVTFTETDGTLSSSDRVVASEGPPSVGIGDGDVTVYRDGEDYKLAYSLSSNTNENAMVAQFALHSGQTIRVNRIPAGATYYVYEYAVGENGGRDDLEDWDTAITWDKSASEIYEIADYRAVRGTISLNDGTAQDVHPVIFTNTAHVGQLTVSKTVSGDQATDADRSQPFTFTVTLKDKDETPLQGTYSYTGAAIEEGVMPPQKGTLTLDANGQATVSLTHGQSITIEDIPNGATYEVTEKDHSGFTVVVDGDTDADQVAEGTIVKDKTAQAQFTNIKQSTLSFTKVAAEDTSHSLQGAKFALFHLECDNPSHDHSGDLVDPDNPAPCWKELEEQTSGGNGAVSFGRLLPNAEYRLVETQAPDGYVLPEGQWKIKTDANNLITITEVADGAQKPPAFAVDENGRWLLPNMKPLDIPALGGQAALPFLMGGGVLMLIAAGIVLGKKLYGKHAAYK